MRRVTKSEFRKVTVKIVKKLLDTVRPLFEDGGKLSLLHPIFEATDTALLSPQIGTTKPPFARDPMDLKRFMISVVLAFVPAYMCAFYFFGLRVLAVLIVGFIAGAAVEIIFAIIRKEDIHEGFFVTGFIFPLILPPATPYWMVALGMIFGVLIGKEIFGGTGRNLFNPALIGRCFLGIAYPAAMAGSYIVPGTGKLGNLLSYVSASATDAITSATPLVLAKSGDLGSWMDLFIGRVAGSAGETSALAILIGGVVLMFTGIANWRTIVATLASFTIFSVLFHSVLPEAAAPASFHLVSGGILFGAFFMATDPVTSPLTQSGKWVYGFIIGLVTILIRCFSGYVEGVTFAILLGNIFAPLIDEVILRARVRRYAREG
jgi:Na(+)-translocating NADH:ubiquinone oxidoreductase B subunit